MNDSLGECWYAVDVEISPSVEEIITWCLWECGIAGIQTLEETRAKIVLSASFESLPDIEHIQSAIENSLTIADLDPIGKQRELQGGALELGGDPEAVTRFRDREAFADEVRRGLDAGLNSRESAQLAFAKATPFEENAYKVPLGQTVLRRALLAAAGLPEISQTGG